MNRTLGLLATVALLSSPMAASAAAPEFYTSLGGGINILQDSEVEGTGINRDVDFDSGWAGIGSVGYHFASGFRTELELGYRDNDVDGITATTLGDGDSHAWTLMLNALYEHGNDTPWAPYIGAGIGFARINYDDIGPLNGGLTLDDDTTEPAWQGIIGMIYKMRENVGLFADYRYLSAISPEMDASNGVNTDIEYDNSTFLVGVRFGFGAAPAPIAEPVAPPPPAPLPPAEPRNYLVFFDFDRADLTAEAKNIINEAAENAKRGGVVRIDLVGHADRAGTDKYNMKLSQRRADSVKAEMVRLGVPDAEIVTAAKGERDPLVPTEDGVREPQNRRVEINYTIQPRQ